MPVLRVAAGQNRWLGLQSGMRAHLEYLQDARRVSGLRQAVEHDAVHQVRRVVGARRLV
jgi:hypothetical protein